MTGATAQGLCEFIDASPSPFHACETVAGRLCAAGYTELAETDRWGDAAGGRFFTVRAGSLIAWNASGHHQPFRIVGAHTDSPNLRVKQHPDLAVAGWRMVALQPYGGAWLNSWLDRDLGLSGRISLRSRDGALEHRMVRFDEPLLRVPQLAIHLAEDRQAFKEVVERCGAESARSLIGHTMDEVLAANGGDVERREEQAGARPNNQLGRHKQPKQEHEPDRGVEKSRPVPSSVRAHAPISSHRRSTCPANTSRRRDIRVRSSAFCTVTSKREDDSGFSRKS